MTVLGIDSNKIITLDDAVTLFSEFSDDVYVEKVKVNYSDYFPTTLSKLKKFIKKHSSTTSRWEKLRHNIQTMTVGRRRAHEMKNRSDRIFYRNAYMSQHNNRYPSETCSSFISRKIHHDPYPYKYDYELERRDYDEKMSQIYSYYTLIFQVELNIRIRENPIIDTIKRDGDVSATVFKIGLRHSQTADTPTCARSFLSSYSEVSQDSRPSFLVAHQPASRSTSRSATISGPSIKTNSDSMPSLIINNPPSLVKHKSAFLTNIESVPGTVK